MKTGFMVVVNSLGIAEMLVGISIGGYYPPSSTIYVIRNKLKKKQEKAHLKTL